MIEVKFDSKAVDAALERLSKAAANPRQALLAIGEGLVVSTKKRFETSTAPDGSRWAPNSQATYLGHLGSAKSNHGKSGRINSRGAAKVMGKKPLIGKGVLAQNINSDENGSSLWISSPMEYAAMQQFGGMTSPRSMIPNKAIPARPFLGISSDDETMILNTVSEYLSSVVR